MFLKKEELFIVELNHPLLGFFVGSSEIWFQFLRSNSINESV